MELHRSVGGKCIHQLRLSTVEVYVGTSISQTKQSRRYESVMRQ